MEADEKIGLSRYYERGVYHRSENKVRFDRTAALGHTMYFRLFDAVTLQHCGNAQDFRRLEHALAAGAAE
jgi:hypothetical protein